MLNQMNAAIRSSAARRTGIQLLQIAAAALLLVIALPAYAASERPIKTRIAPVYPEIAKHKHLDGEVKLQVAIDAFGKVLEVKTISGNQIFVTAAESAVRQWKFEPGAGKSYVGVNVHFNAQ